MTDLSALSVKKCKILETRQNFAKKLNTIGVVKKNRKVFSKHVRNEVRKVF